MYVGKFNNTSLLCDTILIVAQTADSPIDMISNSLKIKRQ